MRRYLRTAKVARVQIVTINIPLLKGMEAKRLLRDVEKEVTSLDGQVEDVVDVPSQDSTFVIATIPTYDFPYLRSNLKTLFEMKWGMDEFEWDLELHKKKPRRKKADTLPEPDITDAYMWWSHYLNREVIRFLSLESIAAWMEEEGFEYNTADGTLSGKSRSFKNFNPHPESTIPLTGTFADELLHDLPASLLKLKPELISSLEQYILGELPHCALDFRDNVRFALEEKGYSPVEINQVLREALNEVSISAALATEKYSRTIMEDEPSYFAWMIDTGIQWDDVYSSMDEEVAYWKEDIVETIHEELTNELEAHLNQNWWTKYRSKYTQP